MWKRDEAVRQPAQPAVPTSDAVAAAPAAAQAGRPETQPIMKSQNSRDVVNIGKSVVIKGELNGSEDLTIEGHVEGKIELKDHVLTIGPNGKIKAAVFAKSVIVLGEVNGNVTATEKVDIRDGGAVDGDIVSPRVAIAEGAHFRGSVDMQRKAGQAQPQGKPAQAQQGQPAQSQAQAHNQPVAAR
jgi:cytoskeletal protein CcmA (bactofilin family)